MNHWWRPGLAVLLAGLWLVARAFGAELTEMEGALHAYPALLDSGGRKLADGEFRQWIENDRLHVVITYDFGNGKRVEERAEFIPRPNLLQEAWSFREEQNKELVRGFEVDFRKKTATGLKRDGKGVQRWNEEVKVDPGRTFAGFGFTLALKSLRERLVKGEKIELQAVAFTPKPRLVAVELHFERRDRVTMGGRQIDGDLFLIHPKVPWIARAVMDVEDTRIWLTTPRPAGFLRWEGPLVEPGDPIIRVDLFAGTESSARSAPRP